MSIVQFGMPPKPLISSLSLSSNFATLGNNSTPASAAYPVANQAVFVPFVLRRPITITGFWAANGSSAAGNVDIGVYDIAGTRIVSTGSTARSGTATIQAISVTAKTIGPGVFYLALAHDGTTGQFYRFNTIVRRLSHLGVYTQTSAFSLPATATFASVASAYLPVFGLSTVSTV